jgi:4-hydroxy 2-oxovalerate aldolase
MGRTDSESWDQSVTRVTWLDCTLRDGGYYNSWDFPLDVVQSYIYAMAECAVDRIEIGFRSLRNDRYRGFAAYVPDSVLASLDIPNSLTLGVMVNTSELICGSQPLEEQLSQLFPSSSKEHLSFVRLATHLEEVEEAVVAAKWLKAEGYDVGVNLMQVSEASPEKLRDIGGSLDSDAIDVLYVADSLGNLNPADISSIISTLRESWVKPLGIHAHDNRGLALANSLAAVEAGAEWVDSTITGMGRGAGNTQSEILVGHLDVLGRVSRVTHSLDNLISNYFAPLKEECGWGVNSHYVHAAMRGIHPTFIQELLSKGAYSALEIDAAINVLGDSGAKRFSKERLSEATSFIEVVRSPQGDWDQADLFEGKRVLLVGAGPTIADHAHALSALASRDDVLVVAANLGSGFPSGLIDAHIACHPLRIIADAQHYKTTGKPLIAPQELLPTRELASLEKDGNLRNLGLNVSPTTQTGAQTGLIELPKAQVLAYSLLACLSGGASEVLLAGFDGYGSGDPRRDEEQALLNSILSLDYRGKMLSITPTKYSLPESSIYAILR